MCFSGKPTTVKKEEIHLWDVKRILFGQAPPEFLLEVFIRSLITYLATVFIMRWLGKRMNGQLTIIEFAVMVMMGAILAVPMQIPDRGILQGLIILTVTLGFLRGINWLAFKNSKFEKILQDEVGLLIKDGVIELKELERTKISRQQLYEVLRSKKIYQLGKVKRFYIEACGIFSLYQEEGQKAGLPIYPPDDDTVLAEQSFATVNACCSCGAIQQKGKKECAVCGKEEWTKAIQ